MVMPMMLMMNLALAQEIKLLPDQLTEGALFGHGASLRGDRALVGAYASGQPTFGSAYVFELGQNPDNPSVFELIQPDPQLHGFGAGVTLSDGRAYVGAPGDDKFPPAIGMVYEFAPGPMGDWQAPPSFTFSGADLGDGFGLAMDVSDDGSTLIVASPLATINGAVEAGSATVFTRVGGNWQLPGFLLTAGDPGTGERFGYGVATSSDGMFVVASTCHAGANMNSQADVFVRSGDGWELLYSFTGEQQGEGFGCSVALDDGTLVVGAIYDDDQHGSVYACAVDEMACEKLERPSSVNGSAGLGIDVAIEGDVIVAGAASDAIDGNGTKVGSFYVYLREGLDWVSNPVDYTASDGAHMDYFGEQVGLAGSTVLIGA